jgi:hypothetical protein
MSKKKQSDSVSKLIKYKENDKTSEVVDYVYQRLSQGASAKEIEVDLKIKYKWGHVRARTIIEVCTDIAFRLNPSYVEEIIGQMRYGTQQTLQALDEMKPYAKTYNQKVDLIKARQRALESNGKFLPTQIDISTSDSDNLRKVLFDLHGIEDKEDK